MNWKSIYKTGIGKEAILNSYDQLLAKSSAPYEELLLDTRYGNSKIIARHFRFRNEVVPIFTDHELSRLTMPVMFIAGEKDVMLDSRKSAERLSRLLPDANVNLLPDAGHVIINLTASILPFLLKRKI